MKKLFILVAFILCGYPVFAWDLMYCGNPYSSYTYDAKVFEHEFLNQNAEQSCKLLGGDPMCIKMHNRAVADYKAGKCKVISNEIRQQLYQARIQSNYKLYYQIWTSI